MATHYATSGDVVIAVPKEDPGCRQYLVLEDAGIVRNDDPSGLDLYLAKHGKNAFTAPTLAVGSVVRLKSGGPEMTVEGMSRTPASGALRLSVAWFDAALHLKQLTLGLPEGCYEVLR